MGCGVSCDRAVAHCADCDRQWENAGVSAQGLQNFASEMKATGSSVGTGLFIGVGVIAAFVLFAYLSKKRKR